ncbi:hypothetical protein HK100_006095 [Physocladia obscura]|uniref:Alginate lyase domain-containing protein n=1 Tax=Physocladia obscura TaxID=109957 RepID=A0AAD5XJ40_9FUNG|nr:hypothetical protein HK100_006095 [Physocladia obscura]
MLYLKNLNFAAGIPLEIGFVGIYRWFWYLFKLAIYLFVYKPIKPRCHPELFPEKDVTIIVPTIDHGKEIEMALMTWLACQPAKIIIVTVEASRQPLELIARRCDPQSQVVRVITVPKANKRLQMIAGINETKTNIIVFCDDDVLWPSTLLTWILAPFENPRVGGVGTSQVAIPLGKRFTIWEILAAYRISIRNVEICATTAIDGGVCCLSGRTAAYRSKILKDSKFQHQFANEFWVKKYHQHSGDDKFLTRWLHSHYWDTWIQACPQVEIKSTFKDNYKFLLQLLRWTRNSWRSDLKSIFFERQIWRRNPFTAYTMIDKFFNPITLLVGPVTVFYYAFHPANIGPNYSVETVIGTPQDIIAIPVWLVFSWYFAIMKIYCLFTLRVTDWGTRAGADDKNIPSRRPTTDNYMDLSRPTELEEITVPGVSTSEASNSSTSSTWGRSTPSTFRGSQSTILPLLVCSLLCFCAVPVSEAATLQKTSFYTSNALVQGNYQQMVNNRNYINSNQYNKQVVFTLSKLRKECDKTLQSSNETTYSVTLKTKLPASNDSKDYYSLARYYFPDTSKPVPNDLPYVDLDPEVNPDIYTIQDHALFGNLTKNVKILSLGYFYLNTLAYATETARAIRQWFIDPKYSLNPNLNYAQVRTNRNDNFSESNGLLDFGLSMHQVFDALILIQDSSAWTEDDDIQLSVWMENYMDWLTTSDIGTSASKGHLAFYDMHKANILIIYEGETLRNNHLTYHAIHLASIGGYLGNTTLMELPSLDSASSNFSVYYLIDTQISDNGSMPYEILRHHAYHYQLFDLSALLLLSQYIISVGKSVPFSYIGSTGFPAQSITGSINYLFPPTYNPESGWPHSIQAISVEIPKFARLLYTAHSLDLEKYPKSNWALEQQNVYPPTPSMYNSSLVSIHSYIQISKALGVNLAATHDIQLLWYDITPYAVEIVWLSVAGDVIISIIGVFMAVGVVALACGIMINFRRKLEYQRVVAEKDKRCGTDKKEKNLMYNFEKSNFLIGDISGGRLMTGSMLKI